MKTTQLFAAIALTLAASGAAWAQEATYEYPQAVTAGKSRSQVQDELVAARADGSIKAYSKSYNPLAMAKSELSRAQVKNEAKTALAVALVGEDSGSFALSHPQRTREAAPVYAHGGK